MRTADGYIISKCLNGDSTAFGLLVDKYKASIYALAYSKLHNFHDAEDVTQEVFVKAYRNLPKLRRWDNFFAWLYSITSNLCKDLLQERSKYSDSEFIEDQSVDMLKASSIRSFHDEMAIESIREALDSIPEIYQQVLTLHYLGDMTGEEISKFLGVSHSAIRQRLSRARAMLKEEVLAMINTNYGQRRLSASFTFRIIEMVKKIRIHPTSGIKSLPYGLSISVCIILVILSFGQHIQINLSDIAMGLSMPSDTKILKVGEIPVDAMKVSMLPFIASKGNGKGVAPDPKGQENAFFMAPQGEGEWTKKADMPTPILLSSIAEVNGKIYVISGCSAWNVLSNANEKYDPITDTWEKMADIPMARLGATATVVNGKIYVIGGRMDNWQVSYPTVQVYDPVTNTWEKKSDMPSGKFFHVAVKVDEKIYIFGGESADGVASLSAYVYDPALDLWQNLKEIPAEFQVDLSPGFAVDNKIYFFGAAGGAVLEFDIINKKWNRLARLPIETYCPAVAMINNKVYIFGGMDGALNGLSSVQVYDIKTDKVEVMKDMPSHRGLFGCDPAPVFNNGIFVIGGSAIFLNGCLGLSTNEVYTLDTIESKSVDPSGKLPKTWGMLKAK
jgi:RNA polymerase sigma factor (sigma-70 family)